MESLEKYLPQFIAFLAQSEPFNKQTPEEIVESVNELSQTEDGVAFLQQAFTMFLQQVRPKGQITDKVRGLATMFKRGGRW